MLIYPLVYQISRERWLGCFSARLILTLWVANLCWLQVQYVVDTEDEAGGDVAVRIERCADGDQGDESSSSGDDERYDPQTVTVPVTLCLAIMVG